MPRGGGAQRRRLCTRQRRRWRRWSRCVAGLGVCTYVGGCTCACNTCGRVGKLCGAGQGACYKGQRREAALAVTPCMLCYVGHAVRTEQLNSRCSNSRNPKKLSLALPPQDGEFDEDGAATPGGLAAPMPSMPLPAAPVPEPAPPPPAAAAPVPMQPFGFHQPLANGLKHAAENPQVRGPQLADSCEERSARLHACEPCLWRPPGHCRTLQRCLLPHQRKINCASPASRWLPSSTVH